MALRNLHGISKILFIVCLIVALIVGATLSYLWTMGYYAPQQFQLPEKPALSIEAVEFSAQDTTFFKIVILNPSYSPRRVNIERLAVLTENDDLYYVNVSPNLPVPLDVGKSRSLTGKWNWANYTGQKVKIIVFVSEGSGPTTIRSLPYVGLTVEAHFNSTISTQKFNVTVQNAEKSATYVNITRITLNHEPLQNITIDDKAVQFPYFLNSSESVTFTCMLNWTAYQGRKVTITVETLQGYIASWQKEV